MAPDTYIPNISVQEEAPKLDHGLFTTPCLRLLEVLARIVVGPRILEYSSKQIREKMAAWDAAVKKQKELNQNNAPAAITVFKNALDAVGLRVRSKDEK